MNKKIIWGVVIAIVVIVGIYYVARTPNMAGVDSSDTAENNDTQNQVAKVGRVVFSVTDAAVNMDTISEINMKVNSVDMHSITNGWVNVSTTPHTYNLLDLNAKNQSALLADTQAKADTYDQIRLVVSSINVKTKTGTVKEAKLPSGELKINTKLLVNSDKTSNISLDFLADKSLHTTGNGSYIFAPVVKTETKSDADVSVDSNNVVVVIGGHMDDTNTVGMDVDGSVKLNFQIDDKIKLNLDNNNMIKVGGVLN